MKGFYIIAPLVVVIAFGMLLKAAGFLRETDRGCLTRILYWIALPALLFRTTYISGGDIGAHKNLFIAAYSSMIIVPLMAFAISSLLTHRGDRRLQAFSAMASFRSNNVYLGLPAVTLALGDPGVASASIFLALTLPGQNLLSIVWGEVLMSRDISLAAMRSLLTRLLKNPLIMSCLSGLLCAQAGVPIPDTIQMSLKLIADTTTGIALILLGGSLEFTNLYAAFKRTWPDVVIKLVLYPAVLWGLMTLWPVDRVMFQAAVIISAMPTAVNTFILASGIGLDESYACETVASTTFLAPLVIPIWVTLLGIG